MLTKRQLPRVLELDIHYTQVGIGNNRIFGVLLYMKQILKNDKHWNLYVDKIELLIDK